MLLDHLILNTLEETELIGQMKCKEFFYDQKHGTLQSKKYPKGVKDIS